MKASAMLVILKLIMCGPSSTQISDDVITKSLEFSQEMRARMFLLHLLQKMNNQQELKEFLHKKHKTASPEMLPIIIHESEYSFVERSKL
jgi:hypothetical protein